MNQQHNPPKLPRVRLGSTDVHLTRLGLGTVPIGGKYEPVTTDEAVATIHAAFEAGMHWFDTAPRYGYGVAEQRLGIALATIPRNAYVLATKVGWRVGADGTKTPDFTADGVERSLTMSLERLQTERIDMVHIHDPDDHYQAAVRDVFPTLAAMRAQGMIRAISVGMNQWQMLAEFVRDVDIDCCLLAGRYTLLEQDALASFLPLCQRNNISLVLGGVYNSGILAQGGGPSALYNYAPAPPHMLARAARIKGMCARHGVPLHVAALQFALAHPAVTSVVVGAKSPREVQANIAALDVVIPKDLWPELRSEGLLHPAAPTP